MKLRVGMTFFSFGELKSCIDMYKKETFSDFSIHDSQSLDCTKKKLFSQRIQNAPPELKYYYANFKCVNGGVFKKKKTCTGARKTSSMKSNCPAIIAVKLSEDGKKLFIEKLIEKHNHELSPELFSSLPKQRRLEPEVRQEVMGLLELNANKKLIREKYSALTQKKITMKDLFNLAAEGKSKKTDFEKMSRALQTTYNCTVKILTNEDQNLQCIYVQDKQMKADFAKYPEILFADWTYELRDIRAPIFVIMVENGNGEAVIAAAGVFLTEEQDNYRWFLKTFKDQNSASSQTQVVMTDKDAKERNVFQEVFPQVVMKICLFHTFQIFNREITPEKFKLSFSRIVEIKSLLQQLCYSTTEEQYMEIYLKLYSLSPQNVMEYYDKNWHDIREEWTSISNDQFSTFLNQTNNRVQNFNSRLKNVITEFSSLEKFLKNFFSVINCNRLEQRARIAKILLNKSTALTDSSLSEFQEKLTPYAYDLVEEQFNDSDGVTEETLTEYQTTEYTCQCTFSKSMHLPCKHIFALRKDKNVSLFHPYLIFTRWTREFYFQSIENPSFSNVDIRKAPQVSETVGQNEKISIVANLTPNQRFEKALAITNKLAQKMLESSYFNEQMSFLQSVYESWTEGNVFLEIHKKSILPNNLSSTSYAQSS